MASVTVRAAQQLANLRVATAETLARRAAMLAEQFRGGHIGQKKAQTVLMWMLFGESDVPPAEVTPSRKPPGHRGGAPETPAPPPPVTYRPTGADQTLAALIASRGPLPFAALAGLSGLDLAEVKRATAGAWFEVDPYDRAIHLSALAYAHLRADRD